MHALDLLFVPALAYQVLSIAGSLKQLRRQRAAREYAPPDFHPGVSILKPLRGLDPNTYEAFVSQIAQDYPEYEVLFGVADGSDQAAEHVRRLQRQFDDIAIELICGADPAPNGKVGVLAELARRAKYPIWVVNDSDIKVTPEYLRRVVAPLVDQNIGLVTCLYQARAHTPASTWESLGIATDFMPSVLVAQLIGVREFGLGSTLAFRAADFAAAGGFAAIADYIADDYQLAKRITASGKRAFLSEYTVETSLGEATWSGIWLHQLRWARTIRTAKGAAYLGLPVAQAGLWILLATLSKSWVIGLGLLSLRWLSAYLAGVIVLRSPVARSMFLLAPFWDLYSFAVWLTSYAGRGVRWRDRVMQIDRDGRIAV